MYSYRGHVLYILSYLHAAALLSSRPDLDPHPGLNVVAYRSRMVIISRDVMYNFVVASSRSSSFVVVCPVVIQDAQLLSLVNIQ